MTIHAHQMKQTKYANNLEYEYSLYLDALKSRGEVIWWAYEGIKLRIGPVGENAWYTPDFMVITKDHRIEIHETKGYRERAGIVRFKAAVAMNPHLAFRLVQQTREGWKVEEF